MTRDEATEATREAAHAATMLAAHIARLRDRLGPLFPLSADALAGWDDDPRERLHALLRMFEQLYDLIGRKLFRGYLVLSGEDAAALSAKNVARRVETLGGLPSADRWLDLGGTRNRLIHDYPLDAVRQADIANIAWRDLDDLLEAAALIVAQLSRDQLL